MDGSTAIVDVGSHTIKAGLGSSVTPEFIPSIAGVHKYRALFPTRPAVAPAARSALFVGREVVARRGLLKLFYPVRHGTVTDWSAMIALLRQTQRQAIYSLRYTSDALLIAPSATEAVSSAAAISAGGLYTSSAVSSSSASPAGAAAAAAAVAGASAWGARPSVYALVESPFTSRVQRRRLVELILERGAGNLRAALPTRASPSHAADNVESAGTAMVEQCSGGERPEQGDDDDEDADRDDYGGREVSHLFCGVAPLLALYSTGQTTGVCIDVGEGVVSTAAAVNGFALTRVMQRVSGGGATGGGVTAYLQTLLPQAGTLSTMYNTSCSRSNNNNNNDDNNNIMGSDVAWNNSSSAGQDGSMPSGSLRPYASHADSPYSMHNNRGSRVCRGTDWAHAQADTMSLLCAGGHVATELVRGIKESCGRVAAQATRGAAGCLDARYRDECNPASSMPLASYSSPNHASRSQQQRHRLPDGSEIAIGSEATEASEVLFEPSLIGSDSPGVADLVMQTVRLSEMELRPQLLSHVLVCGGSTLLAGFGLRMLNELLARTPRDNRVRVVAPAERGYAAWLGTAFLSQLSTFATDMVVTRAEYEEHGESIIHARMFK